MTETDKGKLFLVGAFSLAGTSVVTGALLAAKLGSFTITAVSMGIVLIGLLPFYARQILRTIRRLTRQDWFNLIAQAVFGIFLFRLFLLLGVRQTSTAEAGILTGTTPAITAVLAYFILKERPTGFTAAGIAATVTGIVLLQGSSLFSMRFSAAHIVGNLLVLLAAASESTFNIISRRQKTREGINACLPIHPMVQTLLVSAITLCLSTIPALPESPFDALNAIGLAEWLALVWYGLVVTALAFACFYAGAKRCDAYTIGAFSGLMPLTAMLLSLLLFHERTTGLQWIGSAMILLGMILIGQRRRQHAYD